MNPNNGKKSTTEEFLMKAELKHSGKFKYDKVQYTNAITKVSIYCNKHKDYFDITPNKFLTGSGCNVCNKNIPYTTENFINKIEEHYGNSYNYDLVEYKNFKTNVILYCNNHNGYVEISPKTLLKGKHSCGICSGKVKYNNEIFIEKSKKVHNHENYNYDLVDYKSSEEKVKIKCLVHDNIFEITPKAFLTGRGCSKCGKYGFQPNKPGYFYIQELVLKDDLYYKFGITGDLERRLLEQSRDSACEHKYLVTKYFEIGMDALELEKIIKSTIKCGVLSSEELPSGFTETFHSCDLDAVINIVEQYEK